MLFHVFCICLRSVFCSCIRSMFFFFLHFWVSVVSSVSWKMLWMMFVFHICCFVVAESSLVVLTLWKCLLNSLKLLAKAKKKRRNYSDLIPPLPNEHNRGDFILHSPFLRENPGISKHNIGVMKEVDKPKMLPILRLISHLISPGLQPLWRNRETNP